MQSTKLIALTVKHMQVQQLGDLSVAAFHADDDDVVFHRAVADAI